MNFQIPKLEKVEVSTKDGENQNKIGVMDMDEDVDDRKREFSENINVDLKRPIDMTVPERIGDYLLI